MAGDRGTLSDHLVIRLADEGVPIAAIARVTHRSSEDVELIVRGGIASGLIQIMPAPDWPAGSRVEKRWPTVPAIDVGAINELGMVLRVKLDVTTTEARFLAALLLNERASRSLLMSVSISGRALSDKAVDVFATRVRKKVRLFDSNVECIWGEGYFIPEEGRTAILNHVGWEERRAAAA